MPRQICTLAATALACVITHNATAQTGAGRATRAGANQTADKSKAEDARKRREVREAVAALREAAEAARSFDDLYYSVKIQAEAADALWAFDEQTARAVLRRAWEAANAPGADEAFASEDDPRFEPLDYLLTTREMIITRAAKHDARLAESFMRENARDLAARGEAARGTADSGETCAGPHDVWRHPSEEGNQRLSTANALLNLGAYESAAAIAAPLVAEGASRPLLDFIMRLRTFDPNVADNFYLRLLERTRLDAAADANDVLLLSTPIVSPDLLISIGNDGSTYLMQVYHDDVPREQPSPIPQGVRRAFLDMAAAVLLRPATPRVVTANAGSEALAGYFTIGRLLPFFDLEAPQHATALRARMIALSQGLDEARRKAASEQIETRSLSPKNPTDPLSSDLEKLANTSDERERDKLHFNAVWTATNRKLWDRARQLAAEIGDAETRRAAFALIVMRQVMGVSEAFKDEDVDDDFERAASFVRAADVPPALRALGFAQAAELAARKGKRVRASQLFGEALIAAAQINRRTNLRVATLALLIDAAANFSERSAWELLPQLVVAVEEAEDNPDGDGCAGVSISWSGGTSCVFLTDNVPDSAEIFAKMARLDFTRAVAEAHTLKDELLRADAMVAVARAVLEKRPKGKAAGTR
jgi:hypothetical protein